MTGNRRLRGKLNDFDKALDEVAREAGSDGLSPADQIKKAHELIRKWIEEGTTKKPTDLVDAWIDDSLRRADQRANTAAKALFAMDTPPMLADGDPMLWLPIRVGIVIVTDENDDEDEDEDEPNRTDWRKALYWLTDEDRLSVTERLADVVRQGEIKLKAERERSKRQIDAMHNGHHLHWGPALIAGAFHRGSA